MLSTLRKKRFLSPGELARAVGVSESSVKCWVDAGRVPARLTTGGHRRIELMPALRFVRESGCELADPGILGLPTGSGADDPTDLGDRIFNLLSNGDGEALARTLLALLTARAIDVAALFDGPVCSAMARIGELWDGGHQGIYVEHRATQLLLWVLDRIDALYSPSSDDVIAVGGSIAGDPSLLPTRMAATVLASEGIYPVNLGADTPAAVFLDAADQVGAQVVWLSVSFVEDVRAQGETLGRLADGLARRGLACIAGGREVERLAPFAGELVIGRSMSDLGRFARDFKAGAASAARSPAKP